uniref:Reticulon-like protein n=1 Tax=Neobodo designis TaxID=312471 RepID=A0A7S1QFX4_NEODS|mmetsp:Transcript_41872/g.129410  ORF Transcript_41872/g.129410 Transcript_41872/m.129410 type:complete len:189 (+) Transcript_41872:91-657(+)|eukprot:CAMPEP_0174851760 /NCGR_PEP_ID=MMETSP1114-20130205/23808_1 /TAXON_ID=312471 /ORGANISM="Neobodo designis, Strain CCAP 1951/1" /LENGTH=188 /DNA_ID=CAMNT_0016086315 /DNA_START=94 /DNA_END=660 /DNA_ORIENTATION=+
MPTALIDQLFTDLKELSFNDLVMWKNQRATGFVVGVIAAFLIVFGLLEYTIVTFTCRVLQLSMIAYGVALKLDRAHIKPDDVVDLVTKGIDNAKPHVTNGITALTRVLMWEDPGMSVRVLGVSVLVAMVGNIFSDLTLIFLIALGVFAGPTLYFNNKEKIDEQLATLKRQVDSAVANVPASSAAKKTQ